MAQGNAAPTDTERKFKEGGRITKEQAREFLEGNTLPDNNYTPISFKDVEVHSISRPRWAKKEAGVYMITASYFTDKRTEGEKFYNDIPLRRTEDGVIKVVLLR